MYSDSAHLAAPRFQVAYALFTAYVGSCGFRRVPSSALAQPAIDIFAHSLVLGNTAMAVYHLFRNKAFEPEALAVMTSAYSDVCRVLGLHERDQVETDAVAKKIIEFSQRGERDPARLRESVLRAMQR